MTRSTRSSNTMQYLPSSSLAVLPPCFSRDSFCDGLVDIQTKSKVLCLEPGKPFVAFQTAFQEVLLPQAQVRVIATRPGTTFAHEAGVYVDQTNEVWFTSNLNRSNAGEVSVTISRINLDTFAVEEVLVPHVGLGNGACRYDTRMLFCEQGSLRTPSQLVLVDPHDPASATPILNNFHGRRFNSLNDVTTLSHPRDPKRITIWFTDPTYGYEQGYRPRPQLPSQVYVFDPRSGAVRAVADGFDHPNGICFSPDGATCYVSDTAHIHGSGTVDPSRTSTIYAFDVKWVSAGSNSAPSLQNRRLFAFADSGVPDGIKCDSLGNVYAGCGDGVHVWDATGQLIGKIIFSLVSGGAKGGCANFCFVPGGRMVCFAEDTIYMIEGLAVEGSGL